METRNTAKHPPAARKAPITENHVAQISMLSLRNIALHYRFLTLNMFEDHLGNFRNTFSLRKSDLTALMYDHDFRIKKKIFFYIFIFGWLD